jgi:hypothetical protein
VATELIWASIANAQPVSTKDTPGIQVADVIAWAFTRRLRNKANDPWANLSLLLIGNRARGGLLNSIQLDPLTEDVLREKNPKLG